MFRGFFFLEKLFNMKCSYWMIIKRYRRFKVKKVFYGMNIRFLILLLGVDIILLL